MGIASLVSVIEKIIHEIKVATITQRKPNFTWVKLNIGRSVLSNPRRIGAGGILRNYLGNLLFDVSTPMSIGSNNKADIEAIIFGLI